MSHAIQDRPRRMPTIDDLRREYRRRFRSDAVRFIFAEKRALHDALNGCVSDDVQCEITCLLTPVLTANAVDDVLRDALDAATRMIVAISARHPRDGGVAIACIAALQSIARLVAIDDVAAGRDVLPPNWPAPA